VSVLKRTFLPFHVIAIFDSTSIKIKHKNDTAKALGEKHTKAIETLALTSVAFSFAQCYDETRIIEH